MSLQEISVPINAALYTSHRRASADYDVAGNSNDILCQNVVKSPWAVRLLEPGVSLFRSAQYRRMRSETAFRSAADILHVRLLVLTITVLVCLPSVTNGAQNQTATVRVQVHASEKPVEDAEVVVAGTTHRTDAAGTTTIITVPGAIEITVLKSGFAPMTASVQVAAGATQDVVVTLQAQPTIEETVTVVASTRTDKRLEDQPMRVEVLAREEIEEKMLMTPGDIVMMLNEMGGMRVQATSPSLGAASVRIQGMRGRYTRVLSDGLPLFGEVGGLGLLQIPPMDLGQVEVIKGVASALYGAGAMGGVVNLLSRRPGREPEQEFLLNRSTRGATDAVTFLSGALSRGWSASLLGGGHWQDTNDVNDDAWADLPGYKRAVLRPRVFWDGGNGRTFFATTGFTYEDRDGGTPEGQVLAATGQPYVEALETQRYDAGALGQFLFNGRYVVTARAAVARQSHDHQFGEVIERDRHDTIFGEVAVRGTAGRQTWVGGLAIERDAYAARDVPRFDYAFTVPGAFAQYRRHCVTKSIALCKCSIGRSQRVRHLLQSSRVGARARGSLDEQALGRDRLLRAHADHRRDRGRGTHASRSPPTCRGRAWVERVV